MQCKAMPCCLGALNKHLDISLWQGFKQHPCSTASLPADEAEQSMLLLASGLLRLPASPMAHTYVLSMPGL